MKFSVTSVVLLSGIAAASPITDSGAVARAAKKPFKQPAGAAQSLALCGNGKSAFDTDKAESEDCVGTLEFCNKKFFEKAGEKFADAKACLASREAAPSDDSVVFPDDPRLARNKGNKAPSNANKATANGPKKPFKERATSANFSELCGNSKFAGDLEKTRSEDCQGTLVFCNKKFYEKSKTGEKFASPQECLDSREKPAGAAAAGTPPANNKAKQPAQKKPFKQPASDAQFFDLCGNSKFAGDADKSRSEDCAGTLEFCNKKLFENTDEKFASAKACLDSRQAPK
ncbi:hypothetical protein HIM_08303 [Hirsutella minnesotensis 3608]|uniref:Uncharacterized protein n=1 Tax=Hirsutella minnesotensis 3608 TaxID=1043627 RepID=A0A0F7ZYD1_9HYPO|nr:hypothetical protein HIM_08303 [Hirsutella minnesotensis 3608]